MSSCRRRVVSFTQSVRFPCKHSTSTSASTLPLGCKCSSLPQPQCLRPKAACAFLAAALLLKCATFISAPLPTCLYTFSSSNHTHCYLTPYSPRAAYFPNQHFIPPLHTCSQPWPKLPPAKSAALRALPPAPLLPVAAGFPARTAHAATSCDEFCTVSTT